MAFVVELRLDQRLNRPISSPWARTWSHIARSTPSLFLLTGKHQENQAAGQQGSSLVLILAQQL